MLIVHSSSMSVLSRKDVLRDADGTTVVLMLVVCWRGTLAGGIRLAEVRDAFAVYR